MGADTTIDSVRAAREQLQKRLTISRLGLTLYREMDKDILAMRQADTTLAALLADEDARIRDAEHPELTPEAVTDAAIASVAEWWKPGDPPIRPCCSPNSSNRSQTPPTAPHERTSRRPHET